MNTTTVTRPTAAQTPSHAMDLDVYKFQIEGTRPLLMHSSAGVDPFDERVIELSTLVAKAKSSKTLEAKRAVIPAEWALCAYTEVRGKDTIFTIPCMNVLRAIQDGAKAQRQGQSVERGLIVESVDFHFDPAHEAMCIGRTGWKDLFDVKDDDGESIYVDRRAVGVSKSAVMRTRVIFPRWSLDVTIRIHESQVDVSSLVAAIMVAGEFYGLGDYRPHFGRFRLVDGLVKQ